MASADGCGHLLGSAWLAEERKGCALADCPLALRQRSIYRPRAQQHNSPDTLHLACSFVRPFHRTGYITACSCSFLIVRVSSRLFVRSFTRVRFSSTDSVSKRAMDSKRQKLKSSSEIVEISHWLWACACIPCMRKCLKHMRNSNHSTGVEMSKCLTHNNEQSQTLTLKRSLLTLAIAHALAIARHGNRSQVALLHKLKKEARRSHRSLSSSDHRIR